MIKLSGRSSTIQGGERMARRSLCVDGFPSELIVGDLGSVLILMLGKLLVLAQDDRRAWRAALGSVPLQ
jgi:hypothetical protein